MKDTNGKQRFISIGERLITSIYIVMMVMILVVCVFLNNIDYARKTESMYPEWALLIIGLLMIGIVVLLDKWILDKFFVNYNNKEKIFFPISILFLIFQCYCVWCYYFVTDWDVATIISAAEAVARKESLEEFYDYFSIYPNNLFLVWLYSVIIRFFQWINVNYIMGILVFQSVLSWGTGILLYDTIKQILGNKLTACLGWIIYILLIGISPWVSIPYSDSIGLIFPITILWLWVKKEKISRNRRLWYEIGIGLLTIIGYRIKPQIVIIVIALGIITLLYAIKDIREVSRFFIGLGIGIFIGSIATMTCVHTLNIEIDSEKTFGMSHFLMMGMNYSEGPGGNGVWNLEDVDFSKNFATAKERKEENLHIAKKRIREMGVPGMLHLMHRKVLTDYNDGTFCWGGEKEIFL